MDDSKLFTGEEFKNETIKTDFIKKFQLKSGATSNIKLLPFQQVCCDNELVLFAYAGSAILTINIEKEQTTESV